MGGEIREGDNLYTNSVLALDLKTGKLRWHHQLVHHDVWDVDVAVPVVLYDAVVNGAARKAVAVLRPDGYFFLFDRASGKPLFPIQERPVPQDAFLKTSKTQPFVVGADRVVPECETWKAKVKPPFEVSCPGFAPPSREKHTILSPGFGVNRVVPMAYSPQTGYFYAQGTGSLSRMRRISPDPWFWGFGGQSLVTPPPVDVLAAVDSRTNKIAWRIEAPLGGGLLATAGGLVFRPADDGNVEAFDAKTGKRLWQFQTGRLGRGIPATYEIDGEQYVAVPSGQLMWAFKLGGTVTPEPAPKVPPRGIPIQDATEVETGTLYQSQSGNFGRRWAVDEHTFNPLRARLKAGTRMRFMNNGHDVHSIVAEDGAWSVGPLRSAQSRTVAFDKPGTYRYHCKEHPWAIGEIVVQP
jgi:glucose dehydrogenase/plastocyanin